MQDFQLRAIVKRGACELLAFMDALASAPARLKPFTVKCLIGLALTPGLAGSLPAGATGAIDNAPLERLLAKDEIRERQHRYAMLLDGDGIAQDGRVWAEESFTEDAVFQAFDTAGQPFFVPDGIIGRPAIAAMFGRPQSPMPRPGTARHFMIDIVFDKLTPDEAHTRTSAIIAMGSGMPDLKEAPPYQPLMGMVVYHDDWRKTDQGWKKSRSVVRYTACSAACIAGADSRNGGSYIKD